jgi:hypothetical protein
MLDNIQWVHSGGAKGADTLFSDLFSQFEHIQIIHHSFNHHNIFCESGKFFIHPDRDLFDQRLLLKIICLELNRNYPKQEYIEKLLLRNVFQIKNSELVIGISEIIDFKNCIVKGGTGYAIKLADLLHLPILLLDQKLNKWFYSNNAKGFKELNREPNLKSFPKNITAIGSRELTQTTIERITNLFNIE